jgi:NADPH-dependent ferric siderophore reductase
MVPKMRLPETRKMITLEVVANTRLSPSFANITLGGPELEDLKPAGFDQAVRLFFPREGQDRLRMPSFNSEAWMAEVLLMPKSRRPWVRNLTIRKARPEAGEVDIEFVLHADTPASEWARRTRPGDPAGIFDIGVTYLPPARTSWQLLVGDESALPAIAAALEEVRPGTPAKVFIEVENADEQLPLTCAGDLEISWLHRANGADIVRAVRELEFLPGDVQAFVHGEAGFVFELRRHLLNKRAIPRERLSVSGYWRRGKNEDGWQAEKAEIARAEREAAAS